MERDSFTLKLIDKALEPRKAEIERITSECFSRNQAMEAVGRRKVEKIFLNHNVQR